MSYEEYKQKRDEIRMRNAAYLNECPQPLCFFLYIRTGSSLKYSLSL